MHKFRLAKLVRDKIAQRMIADEKADYRVLNNSAFVKELKKKILEEAKELTQEKEKKKVIKELADIQEIIDALIRTLKFSKKELRDKQREENKKVGSFKKRIFIKTIEIDDDHQLLDYYLADPKKFSQIKK